MINVAFGGSLLQDISTQRPDAITHVDPQLQDQYHHGVRFETSSRLAALYQGHDGGTVNSIHHQAVDRLGGDLEIEARCPQDGIVEAIRARGSMFVAGVQWHPEFHAKDVSLLSGEPLMMAFLAAAHARLEQ